VLQSEGYIRDVNYQERTIAGQIAHSDSDMSVLLKINNAVVHKCTVLKGENSFKFSEIDFSKAYAIEVVLEETQQQLYKKNNTTILLARQRTGTNVLRRFLNSHKDLFAINEIFDPGIYNNKNFDIYSDMYSQIAYRQSDLIGAFFPYQFGLVSELQKPLSYKQTFIKFLDYINLHSTVAHNIIDIKYNHLHNLTDYITPLLNTKNDIFEIIRRKKLTVIHLTRTNYLKSYVSGQLASKSGNYVLSKESQKNEHQNITVTLDVNQLIYSINIMKKEDDFISEHLKEYEGYLPIEYQEMFDQDGNFDKQFSNKVAQFFHVENTFNRAPSLKKLQDRTFNDIIINYGEVVEGLRNTQFEYCLEQ